jgi:hypothetical protein
LTFLPSLLNIEPLRGIREVVAAFIGFIIELALAHGAPVDRVFTLPRLGATTTGAADGFLKGVHVNLPVFLFELLSFH